MTTEALIDAGPLIAAFDHKDSEHKRTLAFLNRFRGVLRTTWPVVTEASHLLDFDGRAQRDLLRWIERGALDVLHLEMADVSRLITLTEKYHDRPMDLADASLVVAAEKSGIKKIVSLDSDFSIYRTKAGHALVNLLK